MHRIRTAFAAALFAAGAAHAAISVSVGDQRFIEQAVRDGLAEVELGRLAQQKAMREEVKQFAARMVTDHGKANDELAQLAQAKGVELPGAISRDHQNLQKRLLELSGADFDREYMRQMANEHQKALTRFEKQARRGKDAELKAFAQRTLPVLQSHMHAAQATRDLWKPHTGEKRRVPPQ